LFQNLIMFTLHAKFEEVEKKNQLNFEIETCSTEPKRERKIISKF
jgi:hypothetical protein